NVVPGRKYYYVIFVKNLDGKYSSGVVVEVRVPLLGEVVDQGDPFEGVEIIGNVDSLIEGLTLRDFLFIQDGNSVRVRGDTVTIDGSKNLSVALKAYRVPPVLKTIAVTLATNPSVDGE